MDRNHQDRRVMCQNLSRPIVFWLRVPLLHPVPELRGGWEGVGGVDLSTSKGLWRYSGRSSLHILLSSSPTLTSPSHSLHTSISALQSDQRKREGEGLGEGRGTEGEIPTVAHTVSAGELGKLKACYAQKSRLSHSKILSILKTDGHGSAPELYLTVQGR